MPVILGDYVYGGKISGYFVCLDAKTGAQIWQTDAVTQLGHGAAMHVTINGDFAFIFTDEGNLIGARLSPGGYEELGRAHLIDPTYLFNGRKVVWPPPAFANKHIFARNDVEVICASLEAGKP